MDSRILRFLFFSGVNVMKTVNFWFIWRALSNLDEKGAGAKGIVSFDPNSEQSVKNAYVVCVLPWFKKLSDIQQREFMVTLAYFLRKDGFTGSEILSQLVDLDMPRPRDERCLFVWLFECLFPHHSVNEVDIQGVCDNNDVMELSRFN